MAVNCVFCQVGVPERNTDLTKNIESPDILHMGIGIAMILSFPSTGRRQPAESNSNRNSGIYRRRHRCLSHHRETMTAPGKTISPHCGKTLPNLSNKH